MAEEEESLQSGREMPIENLPCCFCRHQELCQLWEDGREVCNSFSSKN